MRAHVLTQKSEEATVSSASLLATLLPLPLTCTKHPHDIHCDPSYQDYLMVPSPLQAEVKYGFLEHRGRLSFRKVSSCLCVQWIYLGCTAAACQGFIQDFELEGEETGW